VKDQDLELNSEHIQDRDTPWRRPDLGPLLTDEELIERARKHVPTAARKQRYAKRSPDQLQEDANANWDLTRALLRQYDTLTDKLKWMKMQKLLLAGILGGAAAEGIKVVAILVVKSILANN
jgi:hypothetical protein